MRFRSCVNLTLDDLQSLVSAGLREDRTLDFKRDGVGAADADKREFAADVSALANTGGGHIFYGIDEEEGIATDIVGIEIANVDAEVQRLNGILLTGVEPRLPGVDFAWLPVTDGRGVLVVHAQRSWAAPHRATQTRHFHRRSSTGKYPMDVQELRLAFGEQDRAVSTFREYRTQRAVSLYDQSNAIPTVDEPRLMLHVLPLSSYYELRDFAEDADVWLRPISPHVGSSHRRFVLEGFATTDFANPTGMVTAYTLLSRSGAVEAVSVVGGENEGGRFVDLLETDMMIRTGASQILQRLAALDVPPPWFVFVTLVGVEETRNWHSNPSMQRGRPPYNSRYAFIPEVIVGSADEIDAALFRRAREQLWNAYGFAAPRL